MPRKKPDRPQAERRTWDQLTDADDVLDLDDSAPEPPVEFLRTKKPKKGGADGQGPAKPSPKA